MVDHLLPERYPQEDLFICDVADAVIKDILPQMEHPFFALSKKPDTNIRRYEHNGNYLVITPSVKGLATIYDKDILIYCISQIMAKIRRGEKVSRRVRINSNDLLKFTNRGNGGRDYALLSDALDRLAGTRISTNIQTGGQSHEKKFGLVEEADIVKEHGDRGRLLYCEVTLSDWVFHAIRSQEVLTLNKDYFRLRKPIERRIYELARKHCGRQREWTISLDLLHKKSGSRASLREFRRAVKNLTEGQHLPDYVVHFVDKNKILFKNRAHISERAGGMLDLMPEPEDKEDLYTRASRVAPDFDIAELYDQWRKWNEQKGARLSDPEQAFLKFCEKRQTESTTDFDLSLKAPEAAYKVVNPPVRVPEFVNKQPELLDIWVSDAFREGCVGEGAYCNWFAPCIPEKIEDGVLCIVCPTSFMKEWVRTHFMDKIERYFEQHHAELGIHEISFVVHGEG